MLPRPDADWISSEVARKEGADPATAVVLAHANENFYEGRVSQDELRQVLAATRHPNPRTRDDAFTTLAALRETPFHKQAIAAVGRMKDDPDPGVRDRYVWVNYLVVAPNWREVCESRLGSPSAVERDYARTCLDLGTRPPKRRFYNPNRKE